MSSFKHKKTKLLTALTIIAFTWVILSDLVAMHIHAIYDIDILNSQPFVKTQKSNDKLVKGEKNDTFSDTYSFNSFFKNECDFSFKNNEFIRIIFSKESDFYTFTLLSDYPGRSPPMKIS